MNNLAISGYEVAENVMQAYNDLRFNRTYKSLVLMLQEEEVSLEKTYSGGYETLVEELPEDAPRYIITDFTFTNRAGLESEKIILIFYCPLGSPIRDKMIYSSSRGVIQQKLDGIGLSLEVDEKAALAKEKITKRVLGRLGVG